MEPHWTAAAFPAMMVLAMLNLERYPGLRKWIRVLGLASIPVILLIRTYLIVEIFPLPVHVSRMFHDKDKWALQIHEAAGERPVIFISKYQHASLYWFYNKKPAFSRNTVEYRRNQYDVWNLEEDLDGEAVLLTHLEKTENNQVLKTVWGDVYYYNIENYCSFNRLSVKILDKDGKEVDVGAVGELYSRGPMLFDEYYKMPEKTAASFRGEWFSAGDMA